MNIISPNLNGSTLRIGIVQARFGNHIGSQLTEACAARLQELGVRKENITLLTVPGALEVPLALQHLAFSEEYDALAALGVVVRGETYHFELVSNESGAGISRVALECHIPITNAILTTENDAQAIVRAKIKGAEAADAAVEMANLLRNNSEKMV
ncbi:6,7-dimethyl-8-ribityllumazine synthase [Stenoxybacter acetivorans]|uniref:6,7-dimethyl-8-ribityllumazine synthase n=1 Tax=Stenoxybacter acetivorans TaxID=422441 RepID=UPI000560A393|nr:6,7-dimethyl-8-ribityllumazine synthase [Stenoxybacter acetivorans]